MYMRTLLSATKSLTCITRTRILKEHIEQKNSYSSYGASKPEGDPNQYTECEIVKNPEQWKYVERYLPIKFIPEPPNKSHYPSGWKPVTANSNEVPYFVERTKNHLMPVYLDLSHRGQMKVTKVRRISGDIWLLKNTLVKYLETLNGKKIGVQVDELAGIIRFRGDHVVDVQNWLSERGY